MLAEERKVESMEMFEVPLSVLVARCILTVDEVVVHGDDHRTYAVDHELDSQTLGECGFTRRARSRDEHEARHAALAMSDLVGNLRHLLLVQGLGELDHLEAFLVFACLIELAYVADMQEFIPSDKLLEDTKTLVLYATLSQLVRVLATRDTQEDISLEHLQIK